MANMSFTKHGRRYELVFEQQPIRARMCGFGDKDRRPITPPPCVRLDVFDELTGQEIDANNVVSDFIVLTVDLWHEDGTRAVNLVRHSNSNPGQNSISSTTMTSYPPVPDRPLYMPPLQGVPRWGGSYPSQPQPQPQPVMPYAQPAAPQYGYGANPVSYPYGSTNGGIPQGTPMMPVPTAPNMQNHTRNLIGMNAVNACRLTDTNGKLGLWFVLQDLSVRTEGNFRLKISMCNVGSDTGVISTGKCPVLASAFSSPFTVYSAKKFPGVIESTPLSKCFAHQGIKIPIRKDAIKLSNQAEYDADD
ncbi:velvet factor [Phaeosphaeria sp. MPI-PUGE-AT-0046c]|nr:velvet factor [Phaeosphaeria sp. MPI-PUGE-AT-0046c]